MNVLLATYLVPDSPSGVVTYYRTLTSDLVRSGVLVQTVDAASTPIGWGKVLGLLKRLMRPLGGAFYVMYDEWAYFTGLYLAVRKLRHATFDLIHAQDVRSGVAAYLALGRRVPVLLTCHFNDDPVRELVTQFGLTAGFTRHLTRWYTYLFSYVNNYVFVSHYTYLQSKHLLPATINKQILGNTVQLAVPTRPALTTESTTSRLLISNVGLIDTRKNQKLLLQIGHELRKRGIHNFHLWLIGEGPKRVEYTRLASELDLTDHVTFLGQQATPWLLVAQSDLYIHTALNDNCPYSIVEALAVGTPVLALPVGGIPEMLPEGFGALSGTDIGDLTSQVARYFDLDQRNHLAAAQAAHAAQTFNHQTNLNALLDFYQQTAQQ